jgi:hypothetical protein
MISLFDWRALNQARLEIIRQRRNDQFPRR